VKCAGREGRDKQKRSKARLENWHRLTLARLGWQIVSEMEVEAAKGEPREKGC
jgi:hypothetical protein